MSFNRDIQLDPNRVQTRSGGGRGAVIGGGSILTVIAVVLISQLTGVDLTSMLGAQQQTGTTTSTASSIDTSVCTSGDSANKYTQCRMVATAESLDAVWTEQLPAQAGIKYAKPEFVLWDGTQISSACGNASSAVGPFYCSGDRTVYLDMSFFSEMERSLGAADTPLAEEYIVAHEFGHHIQHLTGQMAKADRSGSGATSDSVRLELQADCYAGIWVNHASSTPDPDTGKPFLGKTDDAGKSYAGSTQAPSSPAPETQKHAEQPAPAEKPADKPAEKPAEAPADKPADAQPAPADKPAEPAAPADEQPSQATSFVPGNLVSEKTAMIVSPSGNIGCDLSAHYAGCGVLSYRSNGTYGKDEAGSPKWWFDLSSGGTPQLAGRSEGAFSLDEAFRGGGSSPQVVEYGQSVTFGSWVCSSEETGMTCRNTETGHGVFLSSGRYETF